MTMIKRNTTPVPAEVKENVKKYLVEHNLGELVDVMRASDHPEDDYLYHVIARKINESKFFHNGEWNYSCWISWNETTQSLNFGHYNLQTQTEARRICYAYFKSITDENVID